MSAVNWIMGIIALLACVGAVYIILEQPAELSPVNKVPSLSMNVPPSLEVGKAFEVQVDARYHAGETIVLSVGEQTYQYICESDACLFNVPLTINQQGSHTLFLQTPSQYAQLPISVALKTSVCLDGTLEGKCSTQTLSQRCVQQKLISDCSLCGCAEGLLCHDSACVSPPYSFTIAVQPASTFYTTSAAPVDVSLTNTASFSVTGFFLVHVDAYNSPGEVVKSFPQQLSLNDIQPNSTYSVSIPVQLPSSTQKIAIRLFRSTPENAEAEFLGESAPVSVSVQSDSSPPAPPSNLAYASSGNGYTLTWTGSSSNDVAAYVVYQQNLATGGFTTYSVLAETASLSYTLPADAQGKAYTVKTKDKAGNESAAVSPIFIS